jgi:NADH-quinone oxidoreductase subunit M
MHDPPKPRTEGVRDLHIGEALLLVPLVALMIFIGLYPKPIGDVSKGSVSTYVAMVQPSAADTGGQ